MQRPRPADRFPRLAARADRPAHAGRDRSRPDDHERLRTAACDARAVRRAARALHAEAPERGELKREIYGLELQSGGGSAASSCWRDRGRLDAARAARHAPPDHAEIQRLECWSATSSPYKNLPIRGGRDRPRGRRRQPGLRASRRSGRRAHRALGARARRGQLQARIAELERAPARHARGRARLRRADARAAERAGQVRRGAPEADRRRSSRRTSSPSRRASASR